MSKPTKGSAQSNHSWFTEQSAPRKRLWPLASVLIFACWMVTFLTCYPGTCSPDSLESIRQLVGIEVWQNHTTLAYTLFVAIPFMPGYLLGGGGLNGMELGVAFNSLFQMIYLSILFGYVCWWLRMKGAPRWFGIAVVVFFALNPYIARYAVTMWKDIPFSAGILLLATIIYDAIASCGASLKKVRNLLGLGVLCVALILLRKNGLLIIVPTLLILAFFNRSNRMTAFRIVGTLALGVLLSLGISGPLYSSLGVRSAHFAETVGIPLQQIGRVVASDGEITNDQRVFLEQIMPLESWKKNYGSTSPDYLKFNEAFDNQFLDTHRSEFMQVWMEMIPPHFGTYCSAWFEATQGYYNAGVWDWIINTGTGIDAPLYSPLDVTEKRPEASEAFPAWLSVPGTNLLVDLTGNEAFEGLRITNDHPLRFVLSPLFSIACMVYLTFLSALAVFIRSKWSRKTCVSSPKDFSESDLTQASSKDRKTEKTRHYLLVYVPLLMLWLSMLISAPTFCEWRYMYAFHLCLPLTFLMPFLPFWRKRTS